MLRMTVPMSFSATCLAPPFQPHCEKSGLNARIHFEGKRNAIAAQSAEPFLFLAADLEEQVRATIVQTRDEKSGSMGVVRDKRTGPIPPEGIGPGIEVAPPFRAARAGLKPGATPEIRTAAKPGGNCLIPPVFWLMVVRSKAGGPWR
jgi:hypothetical protein